MTNESHSSLTTLKFVSFFCLSVYIANGKHRIFQAFYMIHAQQQFCFFFYEVKPNNSIGKLLFICLSFCSTEIVCLVITWQSILGSIKVLFLSRMIDSNDGLSHGLANRILHKTEWKFIKTNVKRKTIKKIIKFCFTKITSFINKISI